MRVNTFSINDVDDSLTSNIAVERLAMQLKAEHPGAINYLRLFLYSLVDNLAKERHRRAIDRGITPMAYVVRDYHDRLGQLRRVVDNVLG